jgi:hypothetical protein
MLRKVAFSPDDNTIAFMTGAWASGNGNDMGTGVTLHSRAGNVHSYLTGFRFLSGGGVHSGEWVDSTKLIVGTDANLFLLGFNGGSLASLGASGTNGVNFALSKSTSNYVYNFADSKLWAWDTSTYAFSIVGTMSGVLGHCATGLLDT